MKQKNKELLFKDLCARLPYHTRVKIWLKDGTTEEGALDLEHNYADVLLDAFYYNKIKDIKPYLRPMTSMTLEEEREYNLTKTLSIIDYPTLESFDWLLAHYFDFRGLIEKGLAIAITEENNPYKIIK